MKSPLPQLLVTLRGATVRFGETTALHGNDLTLRRGDRLAIVGSNGSGKTTLLRLLLGELAPQQGSVRLGTRLEVLYYDQLREQLGLDKTVQENVADGNDTVTINGRPRNVVGYLQDFLFTAERARSPARILSGGERNRLLLARLFTKPSNVLVLYLSNIQGRMCQGQCGRGPGFGGRRGRMNRLCP